jgi:hypothetical protein
MMSDDTKAALFPHIDKFIAEVQDSDAKLVIALWHALLGLQDIYNNPSWVTNPGAIVERALDAVEATMANSDLKNSYTIEEFKKAVKIALVTVRRHDL